MPEEQQSLCNAQLGGHRQGGAHTALSWDGLQRVRAQPSLTRLEALREVSLVCRLWFGGSL